MSDQLTQCPHCQTSFRVTTGQLTAAGGLVRCGACLGLFSAAINAIRVKPDAQPEPAVDDADTILLEEPQLPDDTGYRVYEEYNDEADLFAVRDDADEAPGESTDTTDGAPLLSDNAVPAPSEPQAQTSWPDDEFEPTTILFDDDDDDEQEDDADEYVVDADEYEEEEDDEGEGEGETGTAETLSTAESPAYAFAATDDADDAALFADMLAELHDARREPGFGEQDAAAAILDEYPDSIAPGDADLQDAAADDCTGSEVAAEYDEYEEYEDVEAEEADDEESHDEAFDDAAPSYPEPDVEQGSATYEADQDPAPLHQRPQPPPARTVPAGKAELHDYLARLEDDEDLDPLAPDQLDELVEEPLLLAPARRGRSPLVSAGYLLLALLLGAGLLLQFAAYNLAALQQRPAFAGVEPLVCALLDCPPRQSPAAPEPGSGLYSQELLVRSHPRIRGALELSFVFRNDADAERPFPALELSFKDEQQRLLANRLLLPEHYLPPELRTLSIMPGRSSVQVNLELLDPGAAAVNYSITFRDL